MQKVMVYAYTKVNLGDDLFLKILFERYPNTHFIMFAPRSYKKIFREYNVSIINTDNYFIKVITYILNKIKIKHLLNKLFSKSCDASVYIGGSIFQQTKNWKTKIIERKKLLNKNQPFYVIGANFGPFENEDYYQEYKKLFTKYKDICFRDSYSYNLFRDLSNVRKADDIVFSLKRNKTSIKSKNIIISVVKPSYRENLLNYDNSYYNKIRDISLYFIDKGYDVTLISFCKHEGDEEAIKNIIERIPPQYVNHINKYNYRGNIQEALDYISQSSLVIATRFHAMILGWIYNKHVVPLVYSEKMTNVMKDVGFRGVFAHIENIEQLDPDEVYNSMKSNIIDISEQKTEAEKHFRELDKLLLNES